MSNQQGTLQQQGDKVWQEVSRRYGYQGTSLHCLDMYIEKGHEYVRNKQKEQQQKAR